MYLHGKGKQVSTLGMVHMRLLGGYVLFVLRILTGFPASPCPFVSMCFFKSKFRLPGPICAKKIIVSGHVCIVNGRSLA